MGHLQHVALATHQTVIATIHQPRSAIWEMFDAVRQQHLKGVVVGTVEGFMEVVVAGA
jgi:hypothetical protein